MCDFEKKSVTPTLELYMNVQDQARYQRVAAEDGCKRLSVGLGVNFLSVLESTMISRFSLLCFGVAPQMKSFFN